MKRRLKTTGQPRTVRQRLPELLFVCALFILPFVHTGQSMDPVSISRLIGLSIAVLLLGALLLVASSKTTPGHPPTHRRVMPNALLGYTALVALSITQAGNPAEAYLTTSRAALWTASVIVFSVLLSRSRDTFRWAAKTLTLISIILSIIGLSQYYDVAFEGYVPHAGLANRNLLASALCLMLPFSFNLILNASGTWRWIGICATVLTSSVVVLSNSRATWFALVVAGVTTMIIWWMAKRQARLMNHKRTVARRTLVITAVLMMVVAVLFTSSHLRRSQERSVLTRVTSAIDLERGSVAERLAMWRNSLAMFGDNPGLGTGAGNWQLVSPAYGPMSPRLRQGNLFFQRPHNDYLWILSESGAPALFCYLLVFFTALWGCVVTVRTSDNWSDVTTAASMLFGLTLYMVIAFFSYPMERVVHSTLAAVMLAVALSINGQASVEPSHGRQRSLRTWIVAAVLLAIPSLALGLSRMQSERHIRLAYQARLHGDWASVVDEVDRAESHWIQIDHSSTPLAWHRGVARYNLGEYDAAFGDFKTALKVHPNHLHVLNNLAACHERQGNHDSAEYYYLRALEIQPGFEETLINLAVVYYNEGRYGDALSAIQQVDGETNDERYHRCFEQIRAKLESSVR